MRASARYRQSHSGESRNRSAITPVLSSLACVSILACAGSDAPATARAGDASPFISQTDSISLAENDEFYLGAPADVAVDGQGRIYLSDSFSASVIQFSKSGQPLRKFGRKGKGPGELSGAFTLLVLGDSLLVVADVRNDKLVFYDLQTGAMRREVAHVGIITSIDTIAGGLLLGVMDARNNTSAAIYRFDVDTLRKFGPVPVEYSASPNLRGLLPYSVVAPWGDETMVSAMGSSYLFRLNANYTTLDSLVIPVAVRRGIPADIVAQFNKEASMEDRSLIASALVRARALSDGWLGLIHMDYTVAGDEITARIFLSMLNWKDRKACVDMEVPVAGHARPVASVFGNKFVVVEQVVTGSVRPTTTVRWFTADFDRCRKVAVPVTGM